MCRSLSEGGHRCNGGARGNAVRRHSYAVERAFAALEAGDDARLAHYMDEVLRHRAVILDHSPVAFPPNPRPLPPSLLVRAAVVLATHAHDGQFRRDGRPYIVHPEAVAGRLSDAGLPAHVVAAGWLHDVPEDTRYSLDDLRALGFPERTVRVVRNVTHEAGESYLEASMLRAVQLPESAVVKDADNQHNTSDPLGPTPAQFAKQDARNRKYLEARRIIKRALYATPEGQAELQRLFAERDALAS